MHISIKKTLSIQLLILLGGLQAILAQSSVDVEKNFTGINKIEINGGPLEVSYIGGTDIQEINLNAFLESNRSGLDIVFVTIGDVLKVSYQSNNTKWSGSENTKGYIKISGPESIALNAKNSSGTLRVQNVLGNKTYLSVSSGKITANAIQGDLSAKSSSGHIEVDGVVGSVDCTLTSGMASLQNISGDLIYSASSGSLNASNVDGRAEIKMGSGMARLKNIGELGPLKLSSGSFRADNAGLGSETSLAGTSGSFTIQTPSNLKDFNYNMKASSGMLKVGSISGGRNLDIDNGSQHTVKGSISSGLISISNED
ncbi:DUF4097 family beta strand repeat-containing protein [Pararhodonellum marinum]|uniref:DUF4097 family beta strand repeat-containing protein n=1 Tax=Pararhodonellum marinum TaxID=2755358 RepID=UPI00188E272E|nr:DUF4097 family beta strand repeat-containing protein [Pararhodonellum marinum]